jgi:hypothetical protein
MAKNRIEMCAHRFLRRLFFNSLITQLLWFIAHRRKVQGGLLKALSSVQKGYRLSWDQTRRTRATTATTASALAFFN